MNKTTWPWIVAAFLCWGGPCLADHVMIPVADLDRDLARRVGEILSAEPSLVGQTRNLKIIADNGRVILQGTVATSAAKRLIQNRAEKITGQKLDNQLRT